MAHIVLAADARYLDFARCSLAQIAEHGRAADGVLLLVPAELSDDDARPIRRQAEILGVNLTLAPMVEIEALRERGAVHSRGHVSVFTYSKLFMAEALTDIDEVLYLDIDTLVRDDLTDLLNHRLHHPIGAVRELGNNGVRLFGSTRVPYFNAGVLRMSLQRLRDEHLAAAAVDVLQRNPRLQFQDQDVLNLVFRDRHDALPLAYNVFDSFSDVALPAWKILDDPAIVHFVGPVKPWQSEATSVHARQWRTIHARLLALDTDDADRYVQGDPASWQQRVHRGIVHARHSRSGQRIRARLPMGVKDGLNRSLLALLPHRSLLADEVLKAMNEPAPESGASPAPQQPDVPVTAERPTPAVVRAPQAPAEPSSSRGPLLLVLSLPRSGTNALNTMLKAAVRDVDIEGELYFGQLRDEARERLQDDFPWSSTGGAAVHQGLGQEEVLASQARYRALMSRHAVDLTGALLDGRSSLTVIKVLPTHLEHRSLIDVLAAFRPRVIILRRRLAFSYVSWLKARESGAWFRTDTTDVPLSMADDMARDYIRRADEWFDAVTSACLAAEVDTLDVTYEDLLENGSPYRELRAFLWDCKFRNAVEKTGSLTASSVKQDRRTDGSLAAVLREYGHLSAEVREDLLRHPGSPAGA